MVEIVSVDEIITLTTGVKNLFKNVEIITLTTGVKNLFKNVNKPPARPQYNKNK